MAKQPELLAMIQLNFWTSEYEQHIVERIRKSYACSLSDDKIVQLLWIAFVKWEYYPHGYMGIYVPSRHHALTDEPKDDWFISRITDFIGKSTLRRQKGGK